PNVEGMLADLKAGGVPVIDETPRAGLAGRIAFLHPTACASVLVELATPPPAAEHPDSPVRFKRLVIGCRDPQETAKSYQQLFSLPEVAVNDGPRSMLGWTGGGTLLMVPASEVGGTLGGPDGMAAVLDGRGIRLLRVPDRHRRRPRLRLRARRLSQPAPRLPRLRRADRRGIAADSRPRPRACLRPPALRSRRRRGGGHLHARDHAARRSLRAGPPGAGRRLVPRRLLDGLCPRPPAGRRGGGARGLAKRALRPGPR